MDAARDDDYTDFGISFQAIIVEHLNRVLKDKGIEDQVGRREICETFMTGLASFFDQYWLQYDGKRVHPLLAFSEEYMDAKTPLEGLGKVLFAPGDFSHHEYVFGTVADFYEDDEEALPDIDLGAVGDDEEEEDDGEVDTW